MLLKIIIYRNDNFTVPNANIFQLLLQMYLRKYVEENKINIEQSIINDNGSESTGSIVNNPNHFNTAIQNNNGHLTTNVHNINNNNDVPNIETSTDEENQKNTNDFNYELSWKDISVLISNRSLFNKGNMSYFNDLRRILLNITHNAQLKLESSENFIETMCQLSKLETNYTN